MPRRESAVGHIQRTAECCACGGKLGRVNIVSLRRKANWAYPTSGNVLTGEGGRAVAFVCDACIDGEKEIRRAIEADGEGWKYHDLETLEEMPAERTYVIGPNDRSIQCLRCGKVSHNRLDVLNRWCGRCQAFHEG